KSTAKDLNSSGGVLRTYNYGYDLAGNPTSATSPEGHVTKQTFDALNRATSLIEPVSGSESITTSFGYDATGARTRLTDGRGNATWTSYNSLGLAETVTEPATTAHPDPADRTWTHVYDQAGNQTATIQPGGVRIDRTFDHLGRLTKETGEGGGAASAERTLGYDLAGRQTTLGDLTVDFNDRSLPLSIKRGTVQQTGYSYDALGNPLQRVDAAGTAAFTWDGNNRPDTATDPVTGRKITYRYDPAGNLASLTAVTGTTTTDTQIFTYDDMDRLKTQTLTQGTISGQQLAKITYGWDKDDNLTTKTTAGTAGAGTNTYGYDHAGRLTSWTAPGGATTAYEWDASGNRTKAGNATFTYDERNRLTSGDGTDYTYTARGTLTSSTKADATTNYTFDAFDRLIADGDSLYSYDALDRMTNRIRGTAKQAFSYAGLGNDLAAITDSSGAVQAKYARDLSGSLLGLKEGTGASAAALTDLHGDLVATYATTLQTSTAYDPFGMVIAQTGVKTRLGYQGEYTDPDTGKVNMHARWYQPGTSTFTSRDTATLTPSPSVQANRYTYANASPLTGIDPTGHATISGDAIGGVWGSPYTPGIGSHEANAIYAQYGIGIGGCGGSGLYIGSCGSWEEGGGAVACTIYEDCDAAIVDPDWIRQNEWNPGISEEEAKRQGVMENGRPAPKGYWAEKSEVRKAYMFAYDMGMSDKKLAKLWATLRSAGLKKAWSASGGSVVGPAKSGCYTWKGVPGCIAKGHYDVLVAAQKYGSRSGLTWTDAMTGKYIRLLATDKKAAAAYLKGFKEKFVKTYKDTIKAAAKMFGMPAYLLAGIVYAEVGGDPPVKDTLVNAAKEQFGRDWVTTFGDVQINLNNAGKALGYNPDDMTRDQYDFLKATIKDPNVSIFTAAAYMAYIKNRPGAGYPAPWTARNLQRTVAREWNGSGKDAEEYANRYMTYLPIVKNLL
ncbi:RHS repeat-associated core domain-containing protein, partial [Nonomuraea sp. NPDC046802]|uniref:RHS repeat domain-containing protein n=1 Tax=Nonomuraea sp. NPDC046802 TaxID=3154919 RepID=UPI0033ED3274